MKSRSISKLSKHYPHNALYLLYTNKEVNDQNEQKVNKLKSTLHQLEIVADYPKSYKPTNIIHATGQHKLEPSFEYQGWC